MPRSKEDRATYMREWSERNRDRVNAWVKARRDQRVAMISEIKLAQGCTDCGYRDHPVAPDFDHVRGEKLFSVGSGVARRWELILAEMEKCEVVCSNCHRIRTHERRTAPPQPDISPCPADATSPRASVG